MVLFAYLFGAISSTVGFNDFNSRPIHVWKYIYSVSSCPKFVVIDVKNQGLGDMLARIFSGMATSYLSNTTMVFLQNSWTDSVHHKGGYQIIFEQELGIPMKQILLFDEVRTKYNPTILQPNLNPDESLYNPDFSESMPCNSLYHMSDLIYCTAGSNRNAWCYSYIASTIQNIIRPFFDELIFLRKHNTTLNTIQQPLKSNTLNVVWHIRTGDLCLRCMNKTFYENINTFILKSMKNTLVPINNIVVHQPDHRIQKLFEGLSNVIFHDQSDLTDIVRMFLNSDILITTGSSFANHIALFAPLFKPVIMQATDKDAVQQYHDDFGHRHVDVRVIRDKYEIVEGRAIRIDDDGNIISYQPEDLLFILTANQAISRIEKLVH